MHILIAPNAFKGSLTAKQASECIENGLRQSKLKFTCDQFPIADGGDGTGSLLIEKLGGTIVQVKVHDPLGREIQSSFGLIDNGKTAVIEMADASGIRLLTTRELNPLKVNTFGTGELIKAALDKGVTKIIIALGGSATVDGGAGILAALGIRFLDSGNKVLEATPANLVNLADIDVSGIDQRVLTCELIVLCDVENKLTGNNGAASVFGPQKGASPEDVKVLDSVLLKMAYLASHITGKDMNAVVHGGAAGGTAAGLYAFFNTRLEKGADYFLELTGFAERLEKADVVITGEGSIDEQTLSGKGPFAVAFMAKAKEIPVIGLAGKVPSEICPKLKEYFDVLLPIGNGPVELDTAIKLTVDNLKRTAGEVGSMLAITRIT
ncbi:MAG TPA: glycerate kinase [Sphingobacteriaceae bacterium]